MSMPISETMTCTLRLLMPGIDMTSTMAMWLAELLAHGQWKGADVGEQREP
jgi:hypothetical protein